MKGNLDAEILYLYGALHNGEPSFEKHLKPAADMLLRLQLQLQRTQRAHDEWSTKTEWVQQTSKPAELGMHRADVLRSRIQALELELDSLRKSCAAGRSESI